MGEIDELKKQLADWIVKKQEAEKRIGEMERGTVIGSRENLKKANELNREINEAQAKIVEIRNKIHGLK